MAIKKKPSPRDPKKPKDYTLRDLANMAEALGCWASITLVSNAPPKKPAPVVASILQPQGAKTAMTTEDRERALKYAVQSHENVWGVQAGYETESEVAKALRDCIPVPKEELERYKRALWLFMKESNHRPDGQYIDGGVRSKHSSRTLDTGAGLVAGPMPPTPSLNQWKPTAETRSRRSEA